MERRRSAARALVLALLVTVVLPALLFACPLCKDAQPSNAVAGTNMWRGIYWSILLMIAVPFSAVAAVIVAILKARRKHDQSLAAPSAPLPFPESRGART